MLSALLLPQRRVTSFCRWLRCRSEKVVVMIGHGQFWRSFLRDAVKTQHDRMANCEVVTVQW